MPPKLWPVVVGKAIGTEDSILIVVTEAAAPKMQLYYITFVLTEVKPKS